MRVSQISRAIISFVGFLFGSSVTAFSVAGLLISNVAALVAVLYLYLLVRREFGPQIASRTALYLALFPTGFYLSAIYPESLFLALSIACIYYARKRSWWLAGLCGGIASLTRAQGIMLLVPVAWEYWQVLSEHYAPPPGTSSHMLTERGRIRFASRLRGLVLAGRELRNWLVGLSLLLIPSGLFAFMIYAKVTALERSLDPFKTPT